MPASIKVILHSKRYDDGSQPVMLQCIVTGPAGTVWKRKTICKVKSAQFDKKAGRVKNHPNQIVLNSRIGEAFNAAEDRLNRALLAGELPDPDQILSGVSRPVGPGLLALGQAYLERSKLKVRLRTQEKYSAHLVKLARYLGADKTGRQRDIALDKVDEDWLLGWAAWLRNQGIGSENTLRQYFRFLTTVFNDARHRGLTARNPVALLNLRGQPVRKPRLSADQILILESLELDGNEDDARNTFLLQFYAFGSRVGDAIDWKKTDLTSQDGALYLSYVSQKSRDLIEVRLNPKARLLAERYLSNTPGPYLLPWLSGYEPVPNWSEPANHRRLIRAQELAIARINRALKKVAAKAGFSFPLKTHAARHSFASLADKTITDKRKISQALGHSDFATTERYLEQLRQSELNDAMDAVWNLPRPQGPDMPSNE